MLIIYSGGSDNKQMIIKRKCVFLLFCPKPSDNEHNFIYNSIKITECIRLNIAKRMQDFSNINYKILKEIKQK